MLKLRMVRVFGEGITPSTSEAYRVETVELMTESEAFTYMEEMGSPYEGRKYEPKQRYEAPVGSEVKTRMGVFPAIPMVKQADGSWKPKYESS